MIILYFFTAFAVVFFPLTAFAETKSKTTYPLKISEELQEKYGPHFSLAPGSGLAYASSENVDSFYVVTDGGPGMAPETCSKEARESIEGFRPLYGLIKLKDGEAHLKWLRAIESDSKLDPEGITIGADGTLWIAEELGPSILQVEISSGRVIQTLKPGSGLPEILKERASGKGFEGLTTTPSGNLVAVLQSPLDIKGKTLQKSKLIRIVKIEPESKTVTMFGYDISGDRYRGADDVKLSSIEAIGEDSFFILERIVKAQKALFTLQYIRTDTATPLKRKKKKKEYEFKKSPFSSDLLPATSKTILTFSDFEDTAKPEGVALKDSTGVYIIEDNDFGKSEVGDCFRKDAKTLLRYYPIPPMNVR